MSWGEVSMRAVCALVAVTLVLGGYNLIDEARHGRPPDWVAVGLALPVFAFLIAAFGYWAFVRSW